MFRVWGDGQSGSFSAGIFTLRLRREVSWKKEGGTGEIGRGLFNLS